jgi:hypothetical protein
MKKKNRNKHQSEYLTSDTQRVDNYFVMGIEYPHFRANEVLKTNSVVQKLLNSYQLVPLAEHILQIHRKTIIALLK